MALVPSSFLLLLVRHLLLQAMHLLLLFSFQGVHPSKLVLVASLLVAMPGAPSSFLFLVYRKRRNHIDLELILQRSSVHTSLTSKNKMRSKQFHRFSTGFTGKLEDLVHRLLGPVKHKLILAVCGQKACALLCFRHEKGKQGKRGQGGIHDPECTGICKHKQPNVV